MRRIKIARSKGGYNLAAQYYDGKEKYLCSFEQGKLLPLLGEVANKKILDVGAGTGRLAAYLAKRGANVVALDVSAEMLKLAKKKNGNIKIIVGDAENLPFAADAFDVAVAAFLIVHLKNPARFFNEVYRVLKDNGIFVITNINQKDPSLVKTAAGEIIIESFYHRPEKVKTILQSLAFKIEKEIFIREGENWINQIIVARK